MTHAFAGSGAQTVRVRAESDLGLGPTAVFAIQSEWLSGRPYAQRVANISGTGTGARNNANYFLQPGVTVLNDNAVDTLLGGTELDWVIFRLTQDLFNDEQPGEIKTGT